MRDATPQAVQACHELILWLIPQIDKFPRLRRFSPAPTTTGTGRIRSFNAVNLEQGYGLVEIRTPKEVLYGE